MSPERILGVERDLFDCYADRDPPPGSSDPFLYGCGGWATKTVEKWLNDVPVKVWATGDARYIEDFMNVLTGPVACPESGLHMGGLRTRGRP